MSQSPFVLSPEDNNLQMSKFLELQNDMKVALITISQPSCVNIWNY